NPRNGGEALLCGCWCGGQRVRGGYRRWCVSCCVEESDQGGESSNDHLRRQGPATLPGEKGGGVAAVTVDEADKVPVMLDEHGNRHNFVKMNPLLWIKNYQHFGENFRPGEDQVHVLVVVPE
ncbi:hypothetical protein L914_03731, partial [Phytophthora nicotianae]